MIKVSKRRFKEEPHLDVEADRDNAQLLIDLKESSKTLEEAKKIIEESGAHIIETKHLSHDELLIKLDVKDMRSVALKLTENGFADVRGVNALSLKTD